MLNIINILLLTKNCVLVDTQVFEIGAGKKWDKQTLVRSTVNSGYVYITQFESNPGNFVIF